MRGAHGNWQPNQAEIMLLYLTSSLEEQQETDGAMTMTRTLSANIILTN